MQRGNFRKPNNNYQRAPKGGNTPGKGVKRDVDPWKKKKPGTPPKVTPETPPDAAPDSPSPDNR
jgi:hypothetical protein